MNLLTWLLVKGVKAVSTDTKQEKLKEVIEEHMGNVYAHDLTSDKPYRDDTLPGGLTYDNISIFTHQIDIEKSDVVYYNLSSWFDSGYGDAVIKRFMNVKNSGIFVLGDWNHGFRAPANPYYPKKKMIIPANNAKEAASKFIHHLADFFDLSLKEGSIKNKVLYYYTLGEEKWKKTQKWPPKGQTFERWFLRENNSLSPLKPEEEMGEDTYKINFNATTGNRNRWWTLLSFPIDYTKRTEQDRLCLTYTSNPLEEDLEITGHATITLHLTSTHEDGALFAYLEEVDAEEKVIYLTEGQIRLIHRKISSENPPFNINVPYHSYKKGDADSMKPGEITEVMFGLLPISALIKKGNKIRISISGHDNDTFRRYPFEGDPVITVRRNSVNASFIDLPIIKRDD
jgi:putative CocE/NonD family hydrolase